MPAARGWLFLGCAWLLLAGLLPTAALAQASSAGCGALPTGTLVVDYRPDRWKPDGTYKSHGQILGLIDDAHVTPEMELLVRGRSGGPVAGDLDYALQRIPNHARALVLMIRMGDKLKTDKPPGAIYTIDCYFDRAIRFAPDDTVIKMLFATYLHKTGRTVDARHQLEQAIKLADDNAFTQYNAGLIYFDLKDYDKALAQAHTAMRLGLMRTDLRDRLKALGKWVEPPEPPAEAASAALAASSPAPR